MKKSLICWGLLLLMGVSGADSTRRAMILKVDGNVQAVDKAALTGQLLDLGASLQLAAGSSVTLLLLNKGERLEVKGKGTVRLGDTGLELNGCTSRILDSNQQKLALTGENHRVLGGSTLRAGKPVLAPSTLFDDIQVIPGPRPCLLISRPAGSGAPPKLYCDYVLSYAAPRLVSAQEAEIPTIQFDDQVSAAEVPGRALAGKWQWQIPWPATDEKDLALLVKTSKDSEVPLLYTQVYLTSASEEKELRQVAADVEKWSAKEPGSIQPMVLYAGLLEERGRLDECRMQLDRALTFAKHDRGLLEMKGRVLLGLGRYAQAYPLLR